MGDERVPRRGAWMIGAVATVIVIGLSACDTGTNGAGNQQERSDIARQVVDQLNIEGVGFPCNWDDSTHNDEGNVVYQFACEEHKMIVGADNTEAGVTVWLEQLAKDTPNAWAVVGPKGNYAVTAFDQGSANRAWDLLGADGTVKQLKE